MLNVFAAMFTVLVEILITFVAIFDVLVEILRTLVETSIVLDVIRSDNVFSVTTYVLSCNDTYSDRISVESYVCSLARFILVDSKSISDYSEASSADYLNTFMPVAVSKVLRLEPILIIS